MTKYAEKIMGSAGRVVDKKKRYEYTIPVNYQDCKILIRPFIFSEIVMVSGRWEPYVKSIFDKELQKDHVIVDVGANIGVYAIPLAKKSAKVIAFEPNPDTARTLDKSMRINGIENIVLVKKIAGESENRVKFIMSETPRESGVVDRREDISEMDPTIEGECVRLDLQLEGEKRVDWILIDAEGFEIKVLRGALNVLRKHSPRLIVEFFSENGQAIREILIGEGYTISEIYPNYYYARKVSPATIITTGTGVLT